MCGAFIGRCLVVVCDTVHSNYARLEVMVDS